MFRVSGFVFRVSCFGIQDSGLGFEGERRGTYKAVTARFWSSLEPFSSTRKMV